MRDEQLGRRLASGEAAAFDELYRRYAHRLSAYAAQLLGDGAAGDDVAQTALLEAYGTFRDGRVPEQVRPWLYRVAHNAAIDLVRRRRELPAASLPDRPAAPAPAPGALVSALAALPERQRHVYVLRELHGLRVDEAAGELGLTAAQVEQAQFAARNRLAEHLVFGDRLDCVAVQRLSAGPLDPDERRALKTHLRSCPSCRGALGTRGRILASLPLSALEWLRALGGIGAPAAAKIGAVVAGAGVAAAVPVAAEQNPPHHLPPVASARVAHVAHARSSPPAAVSSAPAVTARPVRTTAVARAQPVSPRSEPAHEGRRHDRGPEHPVAATIVTTTEREHSEDAPVPSQPEPAPVVTETVSSGRGGGDGGGGAGGPGPSTASVDGGSSGGGGDSGDG